MFQAPPVTSYGDYSSYMQAVTQYYSQPATANQAYASKVKNRTPKHLNLLTLKQPFEDVSSLFIKNSNCSSERQKLY